ncbi:MAG: nucleotide exchange factor GrpE [Rhodospirillales bacterium]|nr:nucleotide exchange factor GrpE [Rhodospirillales bacterium]
MTQSKPKATPRTDTDGASENPDFVPSAVAEPDVIGADEIVDAPLSAHDIIPPTADPVDVDIDDDVGEEAGPGERIEILEAQVADLSDKLLRTMAEMENVRRRAQREKEDASKYAIANFAKEMLVVSDNMTRAFASIEGDDLGVNAPADDIANQFGAFIEGVRMTESDLMKTLEKLGVKKIDPIGQRFDANLHEALFEFDDKDQPVGTVAQVLEQGYTLNGRLLRAAKVGITKGGPKAPVAPATGAADEAAGPDGTTAYETKSTEPGGQIDEEL